MERRCPRCNRLNSVEVRRCCCGARFPDTLPRQARRRLANDLPALVAGVLGSLAVQAGLRLLFY